MAALADNSNLVVGGSFLARPAPYNFIVKSGSTVYAGSLVGLERATGHIVPISAAADRAFVGIAQAKVVGDGTLQCAVIPVSFAASRCSVTGASAQTLAGSTVYATTDNTLTVTRPSTYAMPVGMLLNYGGSSGIADVVFFGMAEAALFAQNVKKRIPIATLELADIADTNKLTQKLFGHGKIVEIGAIAWKPPTTAAKTTIGTGAIGGVAITTGAVTYTTAGLTPAGTTQSVTPTALNEFFDGDVFTETFGTTTAFVEGSAQFYIDVDMLP